MKKIMLCLFAFSVNASALQFGDFTYILNAHNPNTVTITDYTGSNETVIIPTIIEGKTVTVIGNHAFRSITSLTDVTIPDSVTSIGDFSFYSCSNLSSLTIGNGVISIEIAAFARCTSLTDVTVPDSVTTIEIQAFYACSNLTSITFGYNTALIEGNVFGECDKLSSVFFLGNAPQISALIFWPKSIATVYYMPAASGWGDTFDDRPTAPWPYPDILYSVDNSKITITDYTGTNSIVVIPEEIYDVPVTAIGSQAFQSNTNLSEITLPNHVTSIGDRTFDGCTGITQVTIPTNVTTIGSGAFSSCINLADISLPEKTTTLGNWLFDGCTSLTNFTILGNITKIGSGTFRSCNSLADITIPDSVTSIWFWAFEGCTSLTNLIIPSDVTMIWPGAFRSCSNLTSITIPGRVTYIGSWAFDNCSAMTAITVETNNPVFSSMDGVLLNHGRTTLIRYPEGKTGNYIIPDSISTIESRAFHSCATTCFYFQGDAPAAADDTFSPDSEVIIYYLPEATGWENTFAGRPTDIWWLGSYTTDGDTITITGYIDPAGHMIIPRTVNSLPVTRIEASAFESCTNLSRVTIPANITSMGDYAFSNCINLATVAFFGNPPILGSDVFHNDTIASIIYMPGTTGWSATYGGRPAYLWNPQAMDAYVDNDNSFVFTIAGSSNLPVCVVVSTNLLDKTWTPLETNALTGGAIQFSDSQSSNRPARYYRFSIP